MERLYNLCFGKNLRKDCQGSKITWPEYIKLFMEEFLEIPEEFYGQNLERFDKSNKRNNSKKIPFVPPKTGSDWASLLTRIKSTGGPNPLAYNLPTTEEEWNQMLKKLEECGVDRAKAIEILRERREKFIQACSIHFS